MASVSLASLGSDGDATADGSPRARSLRRRSMPVLQMRPEIEMRNIGAYDMYSPEMAGAACDERMVTEESAWGDVGEDYWESVDVKPCIVSLTPLAAGEDPLSQQAIEAPPVQPSGSMTVFPVSSQGAASGFSPEDRMAPSLGYRGSTPQRFTRLHSGSGQRGLMRAHSSQTLQRRKRPRTESEDSPDGDDCICDMSDKAFRFCKYLYGEMKYRSEEQQKVIRRRVMDMLDEVE